ncbi:hypothetical protein ACH5RR_000416 [Cinchona calisaya]|uniref:F-box associated domain-containing protein n=1 Tax=Cinchona calisaya TaxID=153742 RepID=A0ABD3B149_9GENT
MHNIVNEWGILVDGICHWRVEEEQEDSERIISFDLDEVKFKEVAPPLAKGLVMSYPPRLVNLVEMKGNLCFADRVAVAQPPTMQIWMLIKEDSLTKITSWVKEYSTPVPGFNFGVPGCDFGEDGYDYGKEDFIPLGDRDGDSESLIYRNGVIDSSNSNEESWLTRRNQKGNRVCVTTTRKKIGGNYYKRQRIGVSLWAWIDVDAASLGKLPKRAQVTAQNMA